MSNPSGIKPVEFNVLVDQDAVESATKGGLYKPDHLVDQEKYAQTKGVIIAVSPMAFSFDDWPADEPKPKPGDRVFFAKHSGTLVKGVDDKEYRVIKDRDVVGVME